MIAKVYFKPHVLALNSSLFNRQILDLSILIFNAAFIKGLIQKNECLYYNKYIFETRTFQWVSTTGFLFILNYIKRLNNIRFERRGLNHASYVHVKFILDKFNNVKLPSKPDKKTYVHIPKKLKDLFLVGEGNENFSLKGFKKKTISEQIEIQTAMIRHYLDFFNLVDYRALL